MTVPDNIKSFVEGVYGSTPIYRISEPADWPFDIFDSENYSVYYALPVGLDYFVLQTGSSPRRGNPGDEYPRNGFCALYAMFHSFAKCWLPIEVDEDAHLLMSIQLIDLIGVDGILELSKKNAVRTWEFTFMCLEHGWPFLIIKNHCYIANEFLRGRDNSSWLGADFLEEDWEAREEVYDGYDEEEKFDLGGRAMNARACVEHGHNDQWSVYTDRNEVLISPPGDQDRCLIYAILFCKKYVDCNPKYMRTYLSQQFNFNKLHLPPKRKDRIEKFDLEVMELQATYGQITTVEDWERVAVHYPMIKLVYHEDSAHAYILLKKDTLTEWVDIEPQVSRLVMPFFPPTTEVEAVIPRSLKGKYVRYDVLQMVKYVDSFIRTKAKYRDFGELQVYGGILNRPNRPRYPSMAIVAENGTLNPLSMYQSWFPEDMSRPPTVPWVRNYDGEKKSYLFTVDEWTYLDPRRLVLDVSVLSAIEDPEGILPQVAQDVPIPGLISFEAESLTDNTNHRDATASNTGFLSSHRVTIMDEASSRRTASFREDPVTVTLDKLITDIKYPSQYIRLISKFTDVIEFDEKNKRKQFHPIFKTARLVLMATHTLSTSDNFDINYRGPSTGMVSKYFTLDNACLPIFDFSAPRPEVRGVSRYAILLLCPDMPDSYPLFNNEGFVQKMNDGTTVITLRGLNEEIVQNNVPVNNLRPHFRYGDGLEFHMMDYVRVGEDCFLAYYRINDMPLVPLEPLVDLSSLHVFGRTEGLYANPILYDEELGLMEQWIGVLNNAERIKAGKPEAVNNIASFIGAVRGFDKIRGDSGKLTFKLLINYTLDKMTRPVIESVGAKDYADRVGAKKTIDKVLAGRSKDKAIAIQLKNEAVNKGYFSFKSSWKRIKHSFKRFFKEEKPLNTTVRPFADLDNTVVGRRNDAVVLEQARIIGNINVIEDHFNVGLAAACAVPEVLVSVPLSKTKKAQLEYIKNEAPKELYNDKLQWNHLRSCDSFMKKSLGKNMTLFYAPLNPSRCPEHDFTSLEWAVKARQCLPQSAPNNPLLFEELGEFVNYLINRKPVPLKLISFDEYLEGVEPKKKRLYKNGYTEFFERGSFKTMMNILVKPYEAQLKGGNMNANQVKPRLIFNPTDAVKALCGWFAKIAKWLLNFILAGAMKLGLTPSGLSRKILRQNNQLDDPIQWEFDGAQHDAHQHEELLRWIDTILMNWAAQMAMPSMGIPPALMKILVDYINTFKTSFVYKLSGPQFRDKGSAPVIVKGVVTGTVYSGHPYRTTLGNSSRIAVIQYLIMKKAGITTRVWGEGKPEAFINQSGDDSHNQLERRRFVDYITHFVEFYSLQKYQASGVGLLGSDFRVRIKHFNFLGKEGKIFNFAQLVELVRPSPKIHTFAYFYEGVAKPEEVNAAIAMHTLHYERDVYEADRAKRPAPKALKGFKFLRDEEFDGDEKVPLDIRYEEQVKVNAAMIVGRSEPPKLIVVEDQMNTVTTTVTKSSNANRNRKNKQRKARKRAALAAAAALAAPIVVPIKKKRRNRRWLNANPADVYINPAGRAAARGGFGIGNPNNKGLSGLQKFARINDLTMEKSVHDILHTLFFSQHGIHRGLARGSTLSSLATYRGSFDIELGTGTTDTTLNMALVPSKLIGDMIYYNIGNTGVLNPFNAATGTVGRISGPFTTTNPSTEYRTVSFTLKIIPVGAALDQNGEGVIAYNSNIPATGGASGNAEWTRDAIDNLTYQMPFRGNEPMIGQWVPNDKETSFLSPVPSAPDTLSMIQLYLYTQAGKAAKWRFEWTVGIEYKATPAMRAFVERSQPKCHPDSFYYVNKVLEDNWDSLVFNNLDRYRAMAIEMGLKGSNNYTVLTSAGSYKVSGRVGDLDNEIPDHGMTETEILRSNESAEGAVYTGLKAAGSLLKSGAKLAGNVACNVMEQTTGYSCDDPATLLSDMIVAGTKKSGNRLRLHEPGYITLE